MFDLPRVGRPSAGRVHATLRWVGSMALTVLALTRPAVADFDDIVVTPLAGTASCYPGTSGPDHVIFLKAKSSQADCDVIGGGSPCLARREFVGDGANGRPISLLAALVQRPSVTGAGDLVAFAEFGFMVCAMQTASEDTEGCVGNGVLGIDPHSIAVNPAGTQFVVTRLDPFTFANPINEIYVIDAATLAFAEPGYAVSVPGPGGGSLQVETVDFTVDGDYLIFDAFNPVTGLWGIYAVSRVTGIVTAVVAPVAGLILRNPALAQTSDDYMVFDAQDSLTGENRVYAANLLNGALSVVATTSLQGTPSYTGDDGAVVFNEVDNGVASLTSLEIQPLAGDRMTPTGARMRWLDDGAVPEVYRRGAWDGTLSPPAQCLPEPTSSAMVAAGSLALLGLGRRCRRLVR